MKFFGIAAVTAVAVTASLAWSDGAEARTAPLSEYAQYHAAIVAAERCRGMDFSVEEHARLHAQIRDRVAQVPQDNLTEIVAASRHMMRETQFLPRCENESVQEALQRFDRELQPALQP